MNKKVLYQWHKRLGLTLGSLMFLLAVSGISLTYRDELLPIVYPNLRVSPKIKRASLAEQIKSAKAYLKDIPFTHYYNSERDDTASLFFFRPQHSSLPYLLPIDPYTAKVKVPMPMLENFFGLMLYIHSTLLLGKPGSWVVGLMGLIFVLFFISGLVLIWPKGKWIERIRRLPTSSARGFHRTLGLFFGLPLLLISVTGFILVFDITNYLGLIVGNKLRPDEMRVSRECHSEDPLRALDLLTREQQNNIVSIHFCSIKSGYIKLTFGHQSRDGLNGFTKLIIDPKKMKIVQTFDTRKDPKNWHSNPLMIYPMHTGAYFGFFGRLIVLFSGFSLAALYLTGIWPTLKKHLKDRWKSPT